MSRCTGLQKDLGQEEGTKRYCTNALHACPSMHVPSFRSVKGISDPHAGQSSGSSCGTLSTWVQSLSIRCPARVLIEASSENGDRRACSSVRRANDEPDAGHGATLDLKRKSQESVPSTVSFGRASRYSRRCLRQIIKTFRSRSWARSEKTWPDLRKTS
jgi:hypothetical protein